MTEATDTDTDTDTATPPAEAAPLLPDETPPVLEADFADPRTRPVIDALREVFDPEIPVDIFLLGLIYKIIMVDERKIEIKMTLTAPGCPVAGEMPGWVQEAAESVDGVDQCDVELVWDPPWDPDKMTEVGKWELGIF